MAVRFQSTFYSEKGRKITVSIKDKDFSGAYGLFDIIRCNIRYDSESTQGQERFTPIIGSSCDLSILINSANLVNLITDIGLAVEGRFTINLTTYQSDNTTVAYNWYGYIVTDLIEFEDLPLAMSYEANIRSIDGLGWLKTLDYKSEVGPYLGQDTVVQHILNCLNQLDFVQSELVANDLPILHTVFNWHEDSLTYSANNDFALKTAIQHRAFYHRDTNNNYIYQNCYEVLKKICQAFGARLIFSGKQYWFIQVNEYSNTPTLHRYYKYSAYGVQVAGTFTDDFTLTNIQENLSNSDLSRIGGGRWTYYNALKNAIVRYNHNAKKNLMPGVIYSYQTNNDPTIVRTDVLDSTIDIAKLSYTGILYQRSIWQTGGGFMPHMFVYAVKVAAIVDYIPLMGFSILQTWSVGTGWQILNGSLFGSTPTGVTEWTGSSVVANKYYYVTIKVSLQSGTLRLRIGGVTKTITQTGDYDYKIYTTNTDSFKLDSTSNPKFIGVIDALQVKRESKFLKRPVNFSNGFNYQLSAASWEDNFYEWEFVTDVIQLDGTEIINKTISFDTLAIPVTGEYVWEMRLKEVRDEFGTDIRADYNIEFYLTHNYLEFMPNGTIQGQSDLLEFGSDNNDKSSAVSIFDVYLGDGPSATTTGALRVLKDDGVYEVSDQWRVSNTGSYKNISQLLVNEIIRGQLTPKKRMIDMPFQNLSINKPYLPHKIIIHDNNYYIFERGDLDLLTEITTGDFFKLELDA
jgi:hypothetical protein